MCLIVYAPKDRSQIPAAHLENAHWRNDDAWGIMYAQNGKLTLLRDVTDHANFRKHWLEAPNNTPIVAHFRYGTSGAMTADMAHPFPVLCDDEGNITLAMMHNGVLSVVDEDKKEKLSDTAVLIRDVIQPMLVSNPHLVEDNGWLEAMGTVIGNPNKLVFMNNNGEVFIVNDWQGDWETGGVWYSNKYSLAPPVTPYKGTTSYGSSAWDGYDGWDDDKPITKVGGGLVVGGSADGFWKKFITQKPNNTNIVGAADACGTQSPLLDPMDLPAQEDEIQYIGGQPFIFKSGIWRQVTKEELEAAVADFERTGTLVTKTVDVTEDEDEFYISEKEAFIDNVYSLSEAEIYNYVVNAKPEDITDIIMNLTGTSDSLYG